MEREKGENRNKNLRRSGTLNECSKTISDYDERHDDEERYSTEFLTPTKIPNPFFNVVCSRVINPVEEMSMFWTKVLFVFDLLSHLDKHGSSYRGYYIENDLKGKENWRWREVRVIEGSSYQG